MARSANLTRVRLNAPPGRLPTCKHPGTKSFLKGNPGGPGNPYAKRVNKFKSLILNAVTEKDMRDIVAALVKKAKTGDIYAIRELLDRMLGKAQATVEVQGETTLAPLRIILTSETQDADGKQMLVEESGDA